MCIEEEFDNAIFIGNTVIKPENGEAFISVVNEIDVTKYKPKFERLHDYKQDVKINPVVSERDKNSSLNICEYYNELFFLLGDKL